MATTIDQIRKVNIYEEDEKGIRTLVQENVPLGSNVVMKGEAPATEELYLLTGKEDKVANTITLYPTKVKVTSGGSIDAADFTMSNSTINGKYVSTITWDEGEDTSKDGTTVYARKLYYNINNNPFPVKKEGEDKILNLLQVPYLELYETNAIKTEKMAKPLLLNVENIVDDNLPSNTKVVLGHTAIKNSTLDMVDNTNGYLGVRLGIDTRDSKRYGYLSFYKTEVKTDNTIDRYVTGSIFTDTDKNFCIIPRNIHYSKIDEPDKDSEGNTIEELPVVSGYLGTEQHQFKSLWAATLHGNIHIPSYTDTTKKDIWLAKLGDEYQIFYVGRDFAKSIDDMPSENTTSGFCITLSAEGKEFKKQIFIRGGTPGLVTEKYMYIRTYRFANKKYGPWSSPLGGSSWHNLTIPSGSNLESIKIDGKGYYKPGKKAIPYLIFNREYLDIYQNNKKSQTTLGLSWYTIYNALNDRTDNEKENNVCIEKRYKRYDNPSSDFILYFGYNDQNQICLWSASTDTSSVQLNIKQYD